MAQVTDVLTSMWIILNTSTILTHLDGRIYKGKRPHENEKAARKNHIVYDTSPMVRERKPAVNNGLININHYVPDMENGQPDFATLETVADAVAAVIEAHSSGNTYFQLDLITDNIYQDPHRDGWSYHNLIIDFAIQD